MNNTITVLPVEQVKIVKRIDLLTQNKNNIEIRIGFIVYEREFSPDYKFVEKKKDEKDFLYLSTYPKQEDYPSDEIDELILLSIKNTFSNSRIHSELLFSSFDTDNLNRLIKRPNEKANFIVRPEFYGQDLVFLVGKSFKAFIKNINVYVDGSSELIKLLTFNGYCKFENHEEVYSRLDKIKFL